MSLVFGKRRITSNARAPVESLFLFLTEILLWVLWWCSAWVSVSKRVPPCLPVSADQRSYLWVTWWSCCVQCVTSCCCMCSPVALEREMELPLPTIEYVKLPLFCQKWRAHMWTTVTIHLTCSSDSGTITWLWGWTLTSSCFLVVLKTEFSKETDWSYFYLLQCAFIISFRLIRKCTGATSLNLLIRA